MQIEDPNHFETELATPTVAPVKVSPFKPKTPKKMDLEETKVSTPRILKGAPPVRKHVQLNQEDAVKLDNVAEPDSDTDEDEK